MTTRVFITKYALTQGIFVKTCEICTNTMVKAVNNTCPEYYHKPDWHLNKPDAINRAVEMRRKKIESIRKQLFKLEKLTFDTGKEL